MENETASGTIPNKPEASTEAPASLLATASTETGKQTPPTETQPPPAPEKPAEGETKPEEKPATETKTEKSGSEEEKPANGAPEKYEDFKAPEGMQFDPDVLTSYSAAAKKANLSQEAAQTLIAEMAPALAERQLAQHKAVYTAWTEQSKVDKEFGGEKLEENKGVILGALNQFDPIPNGQTTTPLRTLLDQTGLCNHPEILRLLYRTGKQISVDTVVQGRTGKVTESDATAVLYPTMQK